MKRFLLWTVSTLLWSIAAACDCRHGDFVSHLPGFNQPLPSPWYSGYLRYELEGRTVHTHYVLVEAEMDFHKTKPLIYWSNGGPGASSLFGLFTEVGPLTLSDLALETDDFRRTGIPTPIYNPYAWTRLGSILVFDQPAPVGFSYCNNETTSDSCSGLGWTDELASTNSYLALQAFYEKFPCYQNTDLYLTGESYAGIYIPTLARRILDDESIDIRLKGFAVGDGCLGTETDLCGGLGNGMPDLWYVLFLAGHGQIPMVTLDEVMRNCQPTFDTGVMLHTSAACDASLQKVNDQAGGFYGYALYDDCTYRNDLMKGGLNDYPCGGYGVMVHYLKNPLVKAALHVSQSEYFSVDNADGFNYTPTEKDLRGFYKEINGKLRVLIYNGDADPAITSFATQNWTSHLGLAETEVWRPWTVDNCRRVGGYVTRYQGNFDFLTIRGAGHMVRTPLRHFHVRGAGELTGVSIIGPHVQSGGDLCLSQELDQ